MFVKFVEQCFWTCVFNLLSQWTCKNGIQKIVKELDWL